MRDEIAHTSTSRPRTTITCGAATWRRGVPARGADMNNAARVRPDGRGVAAERASDGVYTHRDRKSFGLSQLHGASAVTVGEISGYAPRRRLERLMDRSAESP